MLQNVAAERSCFPNAGSNCVHLLLYDAVGDSVRLFWQFVSRFLFNEAGP